MKRTLKMFLEVFQLAGHYVGEFIFGNMAHQVMYDQKIRKKVFMLEAVNPKYMDMTTKQVIDVALYELYVKEAKGEK